MPKATGQQEVKRTRLRWVLYSFLFLQACFGFVPGCPELDVLIALGCPDCPTNEEEEIAIANGIEEIISDGGGPPPSDESPGLPPNSEPDRTPTVSSTLAVLRWICGQDIEIGAFLGSLPIGVEQAAIPNVRSAGFAVTPNASARDRIAGAAPERLIYMSNHIANNVAVLDAATRSLMTTIPAGRSPRGIVITPDGSQVFVANETSRRITVIDTAMQLVSGTIDLPSDSVPYGIDITPDGSTLFVADFKRNGQVHVIDVATEAVTDSINISGFPVQVAVSPDGTLAYVTNSGSRSVSVIDVRTLTRNRGLSVDSPYGIALHPTGNRAYVTSRTVPGMVHEIDTATYETLRSWEVGEKPEFVAIGSDGLRLYVTSRLSNFMNVISLLSGENQTIEDVGFGLGPIALLPPP